MMRAAALLACCCLVQAAKTVPDSCQGTILPYFSDEFETDIGLFVAYLLLMGYFFIGVAVTADLFMNSIEIITSKIKQIKRPDGTILELKIWNDTVANLTLMALGSSAPEILLSIVEVVGRGFEAGELGPGTIVGSAAFNMLMIIAICMTSVKALRVDSIYVLHFTAGSSIFAYIWLYLIVSAISPGEIEVWEAVVTILYFPLFVFVAWLFDTGRLATGAGFIASKMPLPRQHKQLTENASEKLAQELKELEGLDEHSHLTQVAEVRVPWRRKRRLRRLIADIKHQEPGKDPGRVIEQAIAALKDRHALTPGRPEDEPTTIKGLFGFKDSKIKGSWKKQPKLALTISRSELGSDGTLAGGCYIRLVATSNTAEEGVHFKLPQNNRFHFPAGEATEQIATVELLPTEVYQGRKAVELTLEVEGRHHCHWKNRTCRIELKDKLRSKTWLGKMFENLAWMGRAVTQPEPVYNPWLEQIRQSFYPDDDDDDDDNDDNSDDNNDDREMRALNGSVSYDDAPVPRALSVVTGVSDHAMVGESEVDENEGIPQADSVVELGHNVSTVTLTADSNGSLHRQASVEAVSIEESMIEPETPSLLSRIVFYLMLPWNLLFNIVTPPPQYAGGWLAFVFSLAYIGVLTAFVGDLATGLGCTVGLKDAVTAISLVALGTSIPDTFASKIAAENDGADPAIGNVTGSNAVNVFLGVGLSWLAGSAYHYNRGTKFEVEQGTLAFSVVLFSIFAFVWYGVLMLRRSTSAIGVVAQKDSERQGNGTARSLADEAEPPMPLGAELGGAQPYRTLTVALFATMWFVYILLSALVAYGDVEGF
eukprot:m.156800 g.156800  ORF g.156800 m.156800 type:complete len:823 (-) comp16445_c1_seq16:47-2515(-)